MTLFFSTRNPVPPPPCQSRLLVIYPTSVAAASYPIYAHRAGRRSFSAPSSHASSFIPPPVTTALTNHSTLKYNHNGAIQSLHKVCLHRLNWPNLPLNWKLWLISGSRELHVVVLGAGSYHLASHPRSHCAPSTNNHSQVVLERAA